MNKNIIAPLTALALLLNLQTTHAGSATWNSNPATSDWNTAANWTPQTVPNGAADTATFAVSNKRNVNISSATEVAGIVFNAGASAFKFTAGNEVDLTLSGSGIINNSGVPQTFAPNYMTTIFFTNSATAGDQTAFTLAGGCVADFSGTSNAGSGSFTTLVGSASLSGGVSYSESASAANGIFTNNGGNGSGVAGGYTVFRDSASAGNGIFTNKSREVADAYTGGVIYFYDESTAADGTFTNEGNGRVLYSDGAGGDIFFGGTATAGNAVFTNHGGAASGQIGGSVNFTEASTGGAATIICNGGQTEGAGGGIVQFTNVADAQEATLIANGGSNGGDGGKIKFIAVSKGSKANVEVFGNGNLDLTPTSQFGSFDKSIASLSGDGQVILGGKTFSVGGNNLNQRFSGTVQAGGMFDKQGQGNLILTGASTYTGTTIVNGGTLTINNLTGSGTGTSVVVVNAGTLAGKGTISGAVEIFPGGILFPGSGPRKPSVLTMQSTLFFDSSTFAFAVNTRTGLANGVTANGVTLNNAQITASASGHSSLPVGTVFTAIHNTGHTNIVGTFTNLPDGGTIVIGNNTLQANYEGGDGNDLTLTVTQRDRIKRGKRGKEP
jgi:autotransporter-associated beta strand protein